MLICPAPGGRFDRDEWSDDDGPKSYIGDDLRVATAMTGVRGGVEAGHTNGK